MKKIIPCLCFMLLFFMLSAQITKEEALIRQLDQHNASTLVSNDTAAIKQYLAVDFLLNGSNNKISFGGDRILSSMRSGRIKYVQFDVVTDTVYYFNENTAISMGSETAVSRNEGSLSDQLHKRRYTNFWVKEKNVWKLKARHSSIICTN